MSAPAWDDLAPRLVSASVMIGVGLVAVWLGGIWFHALVALVCGLMVWELVHILDPERHRTPGLLGGGTALVALLVMHLPPALALPALLLPAMAGFGRLRQGGVTYALAAALILLAGYGLMGLRDEFGVLWMLWLAVTVVVCDVAGYFAGRAIGGPKFWPRVSPKKTWSGTVAGWIGAAVVGLIFALLTPAGAGLAGISVAVAMASQIGDIAESALKRRAGVKDSSTLIPGHGGLMDRFDGMLGAAVFLVIAGQIVDFPPGAG